MPKLLLPLEVLHAGDLVVKELLDDVAIVHILGHEGHHALPLQLVQLVADQFLESRGELTAALAAESHTVSPSNWLLFF